MHLFFIHPCAFQFVLPAKIRILGLPHAMIGQQLIRNIGPPGDGFADGKDIVLGIIETRDHRSTHQNGQLGKGFAYFGKIY